MTGYLWRGQPGLEELNAAALTWRKDGATGARLAMSAAGQCRNGHPWTAETLRIRPDGTRRCLTCMRLAKAKARSRGAG